MSIVITDIITQWLTVIHMALAIGVTAHVLFHKQDVRSAIGWMGLAWLSPIVGSLLYAVFGINRIRGKVYGIAALRRTLRQHSSTPPPVVRDHLAPLERAIAVITGRPAQPGNTIEPLHNGDAAYPAMLAAIAKAQTSIALSSYIFADDPVGERFISALIDARARGVNIRVLVDGIGSGYFRAPAASALGRHGVPVARFLHSFLPWRTAFLNLRNHRKILVTDGATAFIGGINISAGHVLNEVPRHPIRDVHFRVTGQVVTQIMDAFATDWMFTTAEDLSGPVWFPPLQATGPAEARVITSGPDQDTDKIEVMFMQAISCAQHSIKIATPYFLPEDRLITALSLAVMRGVRVDIVIPSRSNHAIIDWATLAHVELLVEAGGHIWQAPQPFNHAKLLTIDGRWSLIGSANWDVRSMRLNFEINMEVFDIGFATLIEAEIERNKGPILTLEQLQQRPFLIRLRSRAARLLMPYL